MIRLPNVQLLWLEKFEIVTFSTTSRLEHSQMQLDNFSEYEIGFWATVISNGSPYAIRDRCPVLSATLV